MYVVPEAASEVVNFKIFLGEHAPRPQTYFATACLNFLPLQKILH